MLRFLLPTETLNKKLPEYTLKDLGTRIFRYLSKLGKGWGWDSSLVYQRRRLAINLPIYKNHMKYVITINSNTTKQATKSLPFKVSCRKCTLLYFKNVVINR